MSEAETRERSMVSVVVPITSPDVQLRELVEGYSRPLRESGYPFEIVIVLEGRAEFIQEVDGEQRRTAVGPGSTMINPVGVWHTADVEEPMKAIYITPCPGTQHRPR